MASLSGINFIMSLSMASGENIFRAKVTAYITYNIIPVLSTKKERKMASEDERWSLTDKFRLMANMTYFSCLILNWKTPSLFLRCETSKMVFLSGYCINMRKVRKMAKVGEERVF